MTPAPPSPHVGHLIRLAQQIHTRAWNTEVSSEVTSPQVLLLRAIERKPHVDQRTLAALASLDRSTTSVLVERMTERGYIAKAPHPQDRRRHLLDLTPAGRELLAEVIPRVANLHHHLLGVLEPDDAADLVRLLAAFVERNDDLVRAEEVADGGEPSGSPPRGRV